MRTLKIVSHQGKIDQLRKIIENGHYYILVDNFNKVTKQFNPKMKVELFR